MTYDCVVTSDHHPSLCGTAKFSHQLAERLGVPCSSLGHDGPPMNYPLVSVRVSELSRSTVYHFDMPFDVFLHDWEDTEAGRWFLVEATRVFAANSTIAEQIRPFRRDVVTLFAPSTIQGNPHRGTINVLTFGMAHKIQAHRYEKLKALLDGTAEDYTVSVSTAVHEGSPWDETARVADHLRVVFGSKLRVLGYLADDALARELRECSAVALFFDPALRENNTTFWAACAAGRPVIVNADEHSPRGVSFYDIERLDQWPAVLEGAQYVIDYSWQRLTDALSEVPCAS